MAAMIATERRLRMRMPGRDLVVKNVVVSEQSAAAAGCGGKASDWIGRPEQITGG